MRDKDNLIFDQLIIPSPKLPRYVKGYNMPRSINKLLTWGYVSKIMNESEFYWISSISKDGIPHSIPVWGIWFENRVFFDGSPNTKWVKNLKLNSNVSVHLPSPKEVCIIEGKAIVLSDDALSEEHWKMLDEAHKDKYGKLFGSPYIYVNPIRILAWDTDTYEHMTVWDFRNNKN